MSKSNSNDLQKLLDDIQAITNMNLGDIAKRIRITREYLSECKKDGAPNNVNERLIRSLNAQFATELGSKINDTDKIATHDAMLAVLVAEVAALKSERTGEAVQSIIKKLYKAGEISF